MRGLLSQLLKAAWRLFLNILPAKCHVQIDHLRYHRKLPDLKRPSSFSEKTAWRKLYDRDPRMPPLVDKIVAKEIMANRFGADFIIPTLAVFDNEVEVDFASLPYPCVIKANNGSGMHVFLAEQPENEKKIRRTLRRILQYKHFAVTEEWAYSQVKPRLLVEPLINGGEHGLVDYKFQTFNGKVFAIQVDLDRYTNHRRCLMSPTWEKMPVVMTFPFCFDEIEKPSRLQDMLHYAERIGEGFSYVRVDLYEINGTVKFGETTFYPGGGLLETFDPPEFEQLLGDLWNLDPDGTEAGAVL